MFIAPVVTGVAVLERAKEPKVGLVKLERLRVERLVVLVVVVVVVVIIAIVVGVRVGFLC